MGNCEKNIEYQLHSFIFSSEYRLDRVCLEMKDFIDSPFENEFLSKRLT